MSTATKTTDHDEIRRWVEERDGKPAIVDATEGKGGGGILRINFEERGGEDDEGLREIEWDEFFAIFDDNELAFLHQEEGDSRFNKFVSRES